MTGTSEDDYQPVHAEFDDDVEDAPSLDQTASVIGRFTDGSGFLITEGRQAGNRVDAPASPIGLELPPVPSRDAALEGVRPLVLFHKPIQQQQELGGLLAAAHAQSQGALALGYIANMSQFSPANHQTTLTGSATASIRVIDPEGYLAIPGDVRIEPPGQRRLSRSPHLITGGAGGASHIDTQRNLGANLLLTAGWGLQAASATQTMDAAFREADECLSVLEPGERLALNLTLTSQWLVQERLRDALLARLLDEDRFDTWYIRVQWHGVRPHAQPGDVNLLQGYKELGQLATDESRNLLLPQTGLTGWYALAFGAAGFGTGLGGSGQRFPEPQGGGRGPVTEVERYFEPSVLNTIERSSLRVVEASPSFVRCNCGYCRRQPGTTWSHTLANLHCALWHARLARDASLQRNTRGGVRGHIRGRVKAAMKVNQDVGLTGNSEPKHLSTWDQLA